MPLLMCCLIFNINLVCTNCRKSRTNNRNQYLPTTMTTNPMTSHFHYKLCPSSLALFAFLLFASGFHQPLHMAPQPAGVVHMRGFRQGDGANVRKSFVVSSPGVPGATVVSSPTPGFRFGDVRSAHRTSGHPCILRDSAETEPRSDWLRQPHAVEVVWCQIERQPRPHGGEAGFR